MTESTPNNPDNDFTLMDELEDILDDLRTRAKETPHAEFCEGFLAALVCCRRVIPAEEYLEVLLEPEAFADAAQRARFMELWQQRWQEVQTALDTDVDSLEDDAAYQPEVPDVRGVVEQIPEAERANFINGKPLPYFGQVWAVGFMYAVESWPEEWESPIKHKKLAKGHNDALESIIALTEDDPHPPKISLYDDTKPTISLERLNAYSDAIWAVYDLRAIWSQIGSRVPTLQRANLPGRNDPCHCGSGKKFKKCCGA